MGTGLPYTQGLSPLPSLPSPAQGEPRAVGSSEEGEKRVSRGGGDGAVRALVAAILRAPVVRQVPSVAVFLGLL